MDKTKKCIAAKTKNIYLISHHFDFGRAVAQLGRASEPASAA